MIGEQYQEVCVAQADEEAQEMEVAEAPMKRDARRIEMAIQSSELQHRIQTMEQANGIRPTKVVNEVAHYNDPWAGFSGR